MNLDDKATDASTKAEAKKLKAAIDDWNSKFKKIQKESQSSRRKIVVWEVFVDSGGLGHELLNYDNVEVCVFSSPIVVRAACDSDAVSCVGYSRKLWCRSGECT